MDQWLAHRSRYLHLLLEMEGLTKASKCSMCTNMMEIKCSDCIGGNYFCKPCCLQTHKRSPFHRMSRWTGAHFTPASLYSLGFLLCLEHDGEPCPLTVEVWHWASSLICGWHIYRGSELYRKLILKEKHLDRPALNHSKQLMRDRPFLRLIRRMSAYLHTQEAFKEHPTFHLTLLSPCLTTLKEAQRGHALLLREIRCWHWLTKLVFLIWRFCTAFARMQEPEMSNFSKLGYCLQALSKLKQHSPSQFWTTSWQITWSARPQHSNTIQNFKA